MAGRLTSIRQAPVSLVATATLSVDTNGRGLVEITREAQRFVTGAGAAEGTLLLYIRHTSASLVIQENADPDVRTDLIAALDRLAPVGAGWVHDVEGPDDMPAHVKSMLTGASLAVPVMAGRLALGAWQGRHCATSGSVTEAPAKPAARMREAPRNAGSFTGLPSGPSSSPSEAHPPGGATTRQAEPAAQFSDIGAERPTFCAFHSMLLSPCRTRATLPLTTIECSAASASASCVRHRAISSEVAIVNRACYFEDILRQASHSAPPSVMVKAQ